MLAKKNRIYLEIVLVCALGIFIAGCSPSGSRAFFKGKKFLESGDYAGAAEQLKIATTLLATNAQVWNYYGVALQHSGQSTDAALAYQRALTLDRDLMEAHYNLGCLWLEQNKPDDAQAEFTAYTLRRNNEPDGWLKLGEAQLRAGEIVSAEKSFSTALYLNPNNAEALNGLGLARIQRGRPQEAARFFAAAVQYHPDYAPAVLNLATVSQQYLHDTSYALREYRAYLAMSPQPADYDEVKALADSLEKPASVAIANSSPPANQNFESPQPAPVETRTAPTGNAHPAVRANSNPPPPSREQTVPARVQSTEVVKVQPEPEIASSSSPEQTPPPAEKPSVMHRLNPINWFHSSKPAESKPENYADSGVTPLPSPDSSDNRVQLPPLLPPVNSNSTIAAAPAKPVHVVQPAPVFPHYAYLSPRVPSPGNHAPASPAAEAFAKAHSYEQQEKWREAMEFYRQAAKLDPGWFEAQYNLGVLAYREKNFKQSLEAYETALAIQPDSTDVRYNFALALKAAGYALDAVNELKKIVAANPDEVRAQLALGNLYAQQLREPAQARRYYLKVLELDPRNPQATDIRYWLMQNPQ